MTTFHAKAFATRATTSVDTSARTWRTFDRPRVDGWKSRPKSLGSTEFVRMLWASRLALVLPGSPGNERSRSRS
jgi:hypothetical protein